MNTQEFKAMKDRDSFINIAGAWKVKSPYHKRTKYIPFNIDTDGYIRTVEYKGYTPYRYNSFYTIEAIHDLINKGIIIYGYVNFPKGLKPQQY